MNSLKVYYRIIKQCLLLQQVMKYKRLYVLA